MDWIASLFLNPSVGHDILIIAIVIAAGIWLGKMKIFGVSLGVTMVLFMGILFSHFGFVLDPHIGHFFKEFGLILFVYSVGLQVGPGFFSSLRKGGLTLNAIAMGVILLGVITTIVLHFVTGISMATMVGILSGAVTNTPGLGAAGQAYADMHNGLVDPTISLGYAVAYPLGVVGIILSMILLRLFFRVNLKKESDKLEVAEQQEAQDVQAVSVRVTNPAIYGKTVAEMHSLLSNHKYVVSRHYSARTSVISIATGDTMLEADDRIFLILPPTEVEVVQSMVGQAVQMDRKQWIPTESNLVSKQIVVTNGKINGKKLGDLQLRQIYGINVTRVNRSGVDMVASPSLPVLVGDRLLVVGSEAALPKVEEMIGNSEKELRSPNLMGIFLGIAVGVIFGSIPFVIPGIPKEVKLGLAGGPLIVAILLSRFGYRYRLITYTTQSANLMLREIGITIFLACVGLGAGQGFIETIVYRGGWQWIGYGFLITILPLIVMSGIARHFGKLNYFSISGVLAGSMTDPPALAFASSICAKDAPAVAYATVYPLTMFCRVLTAQLLILVFT